MGLRHIIVFLFSLLLASAAFAEDPPELKSQVGGTVQSWFSMDQNDDATNMGFGLRRVRFRYYSQYGKAKLFAQAELTSPKLLDARIEYYFNDVFNIRAGRFIGAGVRSGGLTSHTVIDIVERPFTARRWASNTVGADFRDYGVQAEVKSSGLTGRLWLHNGDGSYNDRNLAGSSVGTDQTSKGIDAMLFYKPESLKGLEVGAHYGVVTKDSTGAANLEKDFDSYSAYAYYKPGGFQLKAEVIGLNNNLSEVSTMGYYVFAGFNATESIELLGRFENFDPNTDVDGDIRSFITLGATYREFAQSTNRVTAALVLANNEMTDSNDTIFQLVWQFVFKSK